MKTPKKSPTISLTKKNNDIKSKTRISENKQKVKRDKKTLTSAPFPQLDRGGVSYEGQVFDIMAHAWLSHFIGWLSPASFNMALFDWLAHMTFSPAKQTDLLKKVGEKIFKSTYAFQCFLAQKEKIHPCLESDPPDPRFKNPSWSQFPFNLYAHSFLSLQQLWHEATSNIRGVSRHHQQVVNFTARQVLDMFSPSNFPWANPQVLEKAYETQGMSFFNGFENFIEDTYRIINKSPPVGTENFQVGQDVAITPGKVIYRNNLIELIQYEPQTRSAYPEPILIIPAWIMKYYILDLSPHNSLVKYLVDQGHTVFMISWKNPSSDDRDLGLEDYLNLGVFEALDKIHKVLPTPYPIHTIGYCIGGTLLMIAAAALANHSDNRIKTITLLAAQVDFKEAGELLLFVDQSQITYLEDIMWERGYLDGSQMAGAFSMLHSNDLVWSHMIHNYLLGERRPMRDLVAWDNDTTRLPFRMHSQYLHNLFLNNDLAQGRFTVNKKKIALIDITSPIFAVGTLTDHVSPWKSVYKVDLFSDTELTFVLTSGGHNAGIVSEPGHSKHTYQIMTHQKGDKHINAETWQEKAPYYKGSWWPQLHEWLASRSGKKTKLPSMGNSKHNLSVLCDAPGTYVFQK